MRTTMKRRTAAAVLVAAAAAGFLCLPLLPCLAVADDADRLLWSCPARPGDGFMLEYTHSVNKGQVREFYTLLPSGGLTLESCTFESYGAGMPDQPPAGAAMTQRDDCIELCYPPNELPELRLIPGDIARQTLTCGERTAELYLLSPYKTTVIRRRFLSLAQMLRS